MKIPKATGIAGISPHGTGLLFRHGRLCDAVPDAGTVLGFFFGTERPGQRIAVDLPLGIVGHRYFFNRIQDFLSL